MNVNDLIKTKNDKVFKVKNNFVFVKKNTICKIVQIHDDYVLVRINDDRRNDVYDYYLTEIELV
ncbi:MAG TPA: hypothetical protein DDW20_03095 [Firmicutes bacterium]|nr:hypothetical protein [Bacillota bacterium]